MKQQTSHIPSTAGHGSDRGYRSMRDVLRAYWRNKDAGGRERSRRSSGGRRKANAQVQRNTNGIQDAETRALMLNVLRRIDALFHR